MAKFSAEVFHNEFLPDGGTDVHAIVAVSCTEAGQAGQSGAAAEIIAVDTSGSMGPAGIAAAQQAANAALDQILDGTWFAIIEGNHLARLAFPRSREPQLAIMGPGTRAEARTAVAGFVADGGTAMGTWLELAAAVFETAPQQAARHAILLTDGKNQHESPEELSARIEAVRGRFQCDCRGVGVNWEVGEVRRISSALMGTVGLIPQPAQMAAEFGELIRASMSRGVAQAELRVWAPQGAQVLFVRQVSPDVEDLAALRREINPLTGGYPTGAWGDESREYHVAIRLSAKAIGQEQLAARVQIAVADQVATQGLIKANWSEDDSLTARINPEVAHYTGQAELASAIQDGLAAKAAGDEETATAKLGRAVQLAAQTGNEEATSRLKKVVEIEEPGTGKVRLRRSVDRLDEMALDTASTKTSRVRR